jgi:hypothetical protein
VATDGGGIECPVCGEGFLDKPSRCFRCESDLELWWPLDQSLRALDGVELPASVAATSGRAASRGRFWRRNAGWVVPVVLLAGLAGAAWLSLESTRRPADTLTQAALPKGRGGVAPSLAAPPASGARHIRYVVQPGDSLWRIAAALTGDARRWPELIRESGGLDPARLRPGQELRLVVEGAP